MKLPRRFQVGVATHTGVVRTTNEDDFLLLAPPSGLPCPFVAAVADGMGGVSGGAEASRSGLRGFASGLLAHDSAGDLAAAVRRGVEAACRRVHEQARAVPALRDMGTTLTAIAFGDQGGVLCHIGDSRAFRLRAGRLQQLTTDHASREQQNRLLRVIGGGQAMEVPDIAPVDLATGDRFLLCSDGVWTTVPVGRIQEVLARNEPQAAAARLLELAIGAGGPDNGTAVVVQVGPVVDADPVEVVLPNEESSRASELARQAARRHRRWPWLLIALAVLVLVAVVLQQAGLFDVWVWLRARF